MMAATRRQIWKVIFMVVMRLIFFRSYFVACVSDSLQIFTKEMTLPNLVGGL
jgi:hypothetical protein